MKNKRPLIYLAAAIIIAFGILWIERPENPRINDVTESYFIPGFDSKNIDKIEIAQLTDGVEIKRDGDNWQVADRNSRGGVSPPAGWRLADHSRVSSALGSFGGLENGPLVSENPDKQSLYRVDDTSGLKVRGYDASGKITFDVVIGKNGPDFASTYIRRANENKVYLINRPITGVFSTRADDWLTK